MSKITHDGLTVWHCSTYMATMGVKGLTAKKNFHITPDKTDMI